MLDPLSRRNILKIYYRDARDTCEVNHDFRLPSTTIFFFPKILSHSRASCFLGIDSGRGLLPLPFCAVVIS